MNYVDLILGFVILLSVISGINRGFIIGIIELFLWMGSLVLGFYTYPYLADFLDKHVPSLHLWTMPLAFIIMVIVARVILAAILYPFLRRIPRSTHRHPFNRGLGLLPGLFNGIIWAAILSTLFLILPLWDGLPRETRTSQIANSLTEGVEVVESKLSPIFDEAVKRTVNKITIEPDSKRIVKLPYSVKKPEVREDLEAEMLGMINEERAKENLPPLKADPEMAKVARKHSADMFARSYFSHINPDGKDPFDRIRQDKVTFITAGENLALAQTLNIAHTGLMNSPGHKANILHRSFGRVGIGIMDGGIYGLMITQNFRN